MNEVERLSAEVADLKEENQRLRAYALYQRLGYQQLQSEPYRKAWEFLDSAGQVHRGEDWAVDMVKQLKG